MTLLILQTLWSPAWAVDVSSSQIASGTIAVKDGAKTLTVPPATGCTGESKVITACGDMYAKLAAGETVKTTIDGNATELVWAARKGDPQPATLDFTTRTLGFGPAAVPTAALLAVPGKGFYPLTADGSALRYATGAQGDLNAAAKACGTACKWVVRAYTATAEGDEFTVTFPATNTTVNTNTSNNNTNNTTRTQAPSCEAVLADTDRLSINPDILCVDVTGSHVSELTNIRDRLLFPNRSLAVVVRHNATDAVTVSVSGDRGYTDPVYDVPSMGQEKVASAQSEDATDTSTVLTELSFAPRKPGKSVDVVIAKNGTTVRTSELEVVPVYIGAVRIGIAAGSAIDQTFGTALAPGSDQTEIVVTSGATTTFQPELVVGFAPFLFTPRGRSYVTARKAIDLKYIAPYLGLGVASLDAEATVKFSLLKSVYVGAEYEMGRYASIGVAAQLRQVTRLSTPYDSHSAGRAASRIYFCRFKA